MSIPIMLPPPPPPPRMHHNMYKSTGSPFHLARRNTWHLSLVPKNSGAPDSESQAMSRSAITKENNTPIASSSRRQPVISEFLRSVRDAQPCARESAVTDEETITTDATESEEESSPLSPETPTPKKHGNKPPKRKRKHKKK